MFLLLFVGNSYSTNTSALVIQEPIPLDSLSVEELGNLASAGNVDAIIAIADRYVEGKGVEKSNFTASVYYEKAAGAGNEKAIAWCAEYFFKESRGYDPANLIVTGWSAQDYHINCLHKAGKYGNVQAMYEIGSMYRTRKDHWGQYKNLNEAEYWLKKAAEKKHIAGSFEYAILLIYEKKNIEEAVQYLKFAADSGYDEAQFYLGRAYEDGKVVTKNYSSMIKYVRMAAMQNHNKAMYSLGIYYYDGRGVKMNLKEAYKWIHKAERNGFNTAIPMGNKLRKMGYR